MSIDKKRKMPICLTIEDEDGMDGWPYDAIVPVVFSKSRKGLEGECSFGAYPILRSYLEEFGAHPFTKKALTVLNERLESYLSSLGCVRGPGVYRYYNSYVLWDRRRLNIGAILPSSQMLTGDLLRAVKVNRTGFDLSELLDAGLPAALTLIGGEVVSLCTINPHGKKQRLLELTVYTRREHRRQGYGRSNAAMLTDYLLQNKRGAVYVTSCRNRASIALAKSLGFVGDSRFYAVDAYKI